MRALGLFIKAAGWSHLVPKKVPVKKPRGGTYEATRYVRSGIEPAAEKKQKGAAEEKPYKLSQEVRGAAAGIQIVIFNRLTTGAGARNDVERREVERSNQAEVKWVKKELDKLSPEERVVVQKKVQEALVESVRKDPKNFNWHRELEARVKMVEEGVPGFRELSGKMRERVEKPAMPDFSDLPKRATDFTDEHIARVFDFYLTQDKSKLKEHRSAIYAQLDEAYENEDQDLIKDLRIKHQIVSNAITEKDRPGYGRNDLPMGKTDTPAMTWPSRKVEKSVVLVPFAKACKGNARETGAAAIRYKTPRKGYPKKRSEYADPKRFKYRLDTEKTARSALSYFSMPKNREGYSAEEQKRVLRRIVRACEGYGVEVSDEVRKRAGLKARKKVRKAIVVYYGLGRRRAHTRHVKTGKVVPVRETTTKVGKKPKVPKSSGKRLKRGARIRVVSGPYVGHEGTVAEGPSYNQPYYFLALTGVRGKDTEEGWVAAPRFYIQEAPLGEARKRK